MSYRRVMPSSRRTSSETSRGRQPRDDGIDVNLLMHLVATMKASAVTVAVDGELVRMNAPLRYAIEPGAVLIVRDAPAAGTMAR